MKLLKEMKVEDQKNLLKRERIYKELNPKSLFEKYLAISYINYLTSSGPGKVFKK